MRTLRTSAVLFLYVFSFPCTFGQENTSQPAAPLPTSVIVQAQAALTGGVSVSDATLTGTATWIAGATNESGDATVKVKLGAVRLDISLPSGRRTEVTLNSAGASGFRIASDGTVYAQPLHNCWTDTGTLFPVLSFLTSSDTRVAWTYIGLETANGATVNHVRSWRKIRSNSERTIAMVQRLSQLDYYLDPTSGRPLIARFNTHPDNDLIRDIAVEIRFSDYRQISGVRVPFHVERYVNGSLNLDLRLAHVVINSGLSDVDFNAQ